MNVDPVGSVQSQRKPDVNEYSDDKSRSLSRAELQTLVEMGEESISQILVGPSSSS